jgi:16S rRNA (guanine966-N2)-methyltransferase
VRITGGDFKGRKVVCPPGVIRPSMDRMRESMFAVLGNIAHCSFLDLFSGSGIVGLEAASRGAEPVVLVEKDFKKKDVLSRNAAIMGSIGSIIFMPAERYIKKFNDPFDIIFLDPPFSYRNKESLIAAVAESNVCPKGGLVLIHHPSSDQIAQTLGCLTQIDQRKYGGSLLAIYKKTAPS